MKYITTLLLILITFSAYSQTVVIDGKEYISDTLVNNSNQILIKYELFTDTSRVRESLNQIDDLIEQYESQIKTTQDEISELRKQKAKLNGIIKKKKGGQSNERNSEPPGMGDKDSGFKPLPPW